MRKRQKVRQGLILLSFFLFPAVFYYLSPVLIVQASAAGIINGSFIIFGLQFVSALVFGRGFCGWICPTAGCQEALFPVREKKVRKGDFCKWLIWVPWVTSIIVLAGLAGGYHTVDFFYQTQYGLSVTNPPSLIVYCIVLFCFIVLPALLVGKRSFCHHLCWMAPFMILGRAVSNRLRGPALGLQADTAICKRCHSCTENCPMSLPVEIMVNLRNMEHSECILCGSCVDICPEGVIAYGWETRRGSGNLIKRGN
jgi:polyferredoxin